MSTQTVGILCGGRSGEHEVSLSSAYGIFGALDRTRFVPLLLAIGKDGTWHAGSADELLLHPGDAARIALSPHAPRVTPVSERGRLMLLEAGTHRPLFEVELLLPIIHGTDGEDGALQGLLRLWNLPFVGSNVLGSAVAMDKDVSKRLCAQADLPQTPWVTLRERPGDPVAAFETLAAQVPPPLFVKPATLGSSVGVSRVETAAAFAQALDEAFAYDTKVVVEAGVPKAREIEISVLGARGSMVCPVRVSRPGEIVPTHAFYSYEAKYLDPDGARLIIPAELPDGLEARVQELAVRTFEVLELEGLARIDFFLTSEGRLLLNEANTLPGFTPISMYPKLWAASGLAYPDLLSTLLDLAMERHQRNKALRRDFRHV